MTRELRASFRTLIGINVISDIGPDERVTLVRIGQQFFVFLSIPQGSKHARPKDAA